MTRRALLERVVRALASYERPSASDGERRAAEWIADELREAGCRGVRVEEERAHGGYWWPLGLLNAGALVASLLAGRRGAALGGAAAAVAVYDDVGGGGLWFRRATLPKRPTWNVVAEAGDPAAKRTVVFVAHHDAAHSGLVFHPALPRIGMKLAPKLHERAEHSVPILYGTFLGPLLLALWGVLGARALRAAGTVFTLGASAVMANIGASRVVPGANDNLSAVAVVVALAHSLRERRPEGVRVLLVSTGSEESFMEGMQAFAKRHLAALERETTEVVCLECIGSPYLCVVEGEGMLRMRYYTPETRERLARAGLDAGVELTRGLRTVAATDGLIALRAGYPTCTLGGVDEAKFPANYHWSTDTPDNLDWDSVEGALAVCEEFVGGRAKTAGAA